MGAIELFEKHQLIVDLMANRWNFAVSGSGTVTLYDPEAFEETSRKSGAKVDLQLNNGATLKLKPGKSLEKLTEANLSGKSHWGPVEGNHGLLHAAGHE